MSFFSKENFGEPAEGSMYFAGSEDQGEAPAQQRRQTTPIPARCRPEMVRISKEQMHEAMGFYFDYMFDAPQGTYSVSSVDILFDGVEIFLGDKK